MAEFVKKPVRIEAWPVNEIAGAAMRDWKSLPPSISEAYERGEILFPVGDDHKPYVRIVTLEGIMDGKRGDWIIRGIQGEFYPCKPDIFEATYEAARVSGSGNPQT